VTPSSFQGGQHLGQETPNLERPASTQEQVKSLKPFLICALSVVHPEIAACGLQTEIAGPIQHAASLCLLRH
jgi:hypothetical protein